MGIFPKPILFCQNNNLDSDCFKLKTLPTGHLKQMDDNKLDLILIPVLIKDFKNKTSQKLALD